MDQWFRTQQYRYQQPFRMALPTTKKISGESFSYTAITEDLQKSTVGKSSSMHSAVSPLHPLNYLPAQILTNPFIVK